MTCQAIVPSRCSSRSTTATQPVCCLLLPNAAIRAPPVSFLSAAGFSRSLSPFWSACVLITVCCLDSFEARKGTATSQAKYLTEPGPELSCPSVALVAALCPCIGVLADDRVLHASLLPALQQSLVGDECFPTYASFCFDIATSTKWAVLLDAVGQTFAHISDC